MCGEALEQLDESLPQSIPRWCLQHRLVNGEPFSGEQVVVWWILVTLEEGAHCGKGLFVILSLFERVKTVSHVFLKYLFVSGTAVKVNVSI